MTYSAVFPPMATPFVDGEVDSAAITRNVERWMRTGLGGIVALGTNGEAALLDELEADTVIAAAREAVPRDRILIAGTGRESTRATIDATRRAASLGATAALVRTPSIFKARMTGDAFLRHYTAVADASEIPILLYNFPALTGVNLAPETVARLAEHPNIAGMKESSADAAQMTALVDATKPPFAVLVGAAPAFLAGLAAGAVGAILAVACVAPDACVRLLEAFVAGRHTEARELQRAISPLARLVTTVHGIPGLKAAMDLAGYSGGDPRPPLGPVGRDAVEQIRAALITIQEHV